MKICTCCGEEKDDSAFAKKRTGIQPRCRGCQALCTRAHYAANKPSYLARNEARRQVVREGLLAYLLEHPCVDCGEADPVVLQFDHVRGAKVKSLGVVAVSGWSWVRVLSEIAKCEVRCANCHTRKTSKQFNWFRQKQPRQDLNLESQRS